jgi:DNA-binding CsgD family transcriptional regulator
MTEEPIEPLSERELELVTLLSEGLSNREIARKLSISPNTVKVHLRNIYGKLQVSSRTEATMLAVRMGWVAVSQPLGDADGGPLPVSTADGGVQAVSAGPDSAPSAVAGGANRLPLALWQRIYLAASALLVALGLWLTRPNSAEQTEPFTDRPSQTVTRSQAQASRWKAVAQMPTPRDRLAVVAHNGRIYAIGGETASGITGLVEIYLPEEDSWVRGADKPLPVANVGAAVLDGRIYVPGGSLSDGQISNQLEVYDPSADAPGTWVPASPMPRNLSAYAIAAWNGNLYVFGGWDGQGYVAESYRYDPSQDAWSAALPMKVERAFAGAGTIGDRIFVVGGYDGQAELAACEAYAPATDSWDACPPMTVPRGGIGVAVIADALYAIGGGWKSYLVENEYFSPATGAWNTFTSPLLQEWRNLGVAANGTYLYAIGGWDGGFLGVNQAYRAVYRLYMPSTLGQSGASTTD